MKTTLCLILFYALVLFVSLRGLPGDLNIQTLSASELQANSPFELSPERGRYALLISMVENKSFYFSLPIARFATPDLGYKNGHYVSLFAPAVSFLAVPGYILGKAFGISQVGAFSTISLFALVNFFLIRAIAIKLGAKKVAATIAAVIFLFATPAFSYAVTLYQHHISTFLILMSLFILLKWNNFLSLATVWFLSAASIPVDYPNLFLMFPIGLFALGCFINLNVFNSRLTIKVKPVKILTFVGFVFPLLFFMWFNQKSYGHPFQFSGTVPGVRAIDENGKPTLPKTANLEDVEKYVNPDTQHKSAISFFKSRSLINGFYIQLFSPDRGVIFFTPVILLGIFGAALLYHKKEPIYPILVGVVGANLLLYSMWGDPWGGWAFGSRYLIPSYAIMAIFIAIFLTRFSKNIPILVAFLVLSFYSISVNALGALTSSANPPQVEVLGLEKQSGLVQKYTYERNWDFLRAGNSKSFVFQTFASRYLKSWQYFYLVVGGINLVFLFLIIRLALNKNDH